MNYRELLKKYINHVANCEGVTFISQLHKNSFTEEEIEELIKLDKESQHQL